MKIILKTDVPKVGRRGEVKEVPDGFARNFLLKQGKAVQATPSSLAQKESEQKHKTDAVQSLYERVDKALDEIGARELLLARGGNEEGSLFAALKAGDLVNELKKQWNIVLPPEVLLLEKPIKKMGKYEIPLSSPSGKKGILVCVVGSL